MSNKYLEKAASLFPSHDYKKALPKDEKKTYDKAYKKSDTSSIKSYAKSTGAGAIANVGMIAGGLAGAMLTKKPAQFAAKQVWKRNILKGLHSDVATSKGIQAHGATRLAGAIGGAVVGSIPGASMLDKQRHRHASGVVENNRKNKND